MPSAGWLRERHAKLTPLLQREQLTSLPSGTFASNLAGGKVANLLAFSLSFPNGSMPIRIKLLIFYVFLAYCNSGWWEGNRFGRKKYLA